MGITRVPFCLTYRFPDLFYIHENSTEALAPYYSINNLQKELQKYDHSHINIILWCKDNNFSKEVMCLESLDN